MRGMHTGILIIIELHPRGASPANLNTTTRAEPTATAATTASLLLSQRLPNSTSTGAANEGVSGSDRERAWGLWWQKCQDPDCRAVNFRSPKRPVPRQVSLPHFPLPLSSCHPQHAWNVSTKLLASPTRLPALLNPQLYARHPTPCAMETRPGLQT
jgi:hypothetical protein